VRGRLISKLGLITAALVACGRGGDTENTTTEAANFIDRWTLAAQPRWAAWRAAEWEAHTHIRENDSTFAEKAAEARAAWEAEIGRPEWATQARDVLTTALDLHVKAAADPTLRGPTDADLAAIEQIRLLARAYAESGRDARQRRDQALGVHLRTHDRSLPKLDGMPIPSEEIEGRYRAAYDLNERAVLWSASLSVARELKPSYVALRDAQNQVAAKAGWDNHHAAVLAPYGMKPDEMEATLRSAEQALRPLYRQLHTWARHELAARFAQEPPEQLPVHWLDDPLGGTWSGTFRIQGVDPSEGLLGQGADGMIRQAESWFTSNGLPPLSAELWARSSFYPADPAGRYFKTPGASTWDLNLGSDIRVMMSATPSEPWMHASHRELAYAHAFEARDRAGLPAPLRTQAPGALLDALATWADLAASRPQRLAQLGLLPAAALPDETLRLLEEAVTWVPFIPFAAGTVATFEREVYAGKLPNDQLTARWWDLALIHQGVLPPETRTERWADPLYLGQLTDMPGRYFEKALSTMIAFQLHEKLCADLGVDPRHGDLSNAPAVGEAFRNVAAQAGVQPWRKVVKDATGQEPSAEAMVRHFEPLMAWLQEQNAGRTATLPAKL
jgi:peptidyl-dipeptidase A